MGNLIKELPEHLRPYEKAALLGVEALDDAELLAIILRTGSSKEGVLELSRRLLSDSGGRISALRHLSKEELMSFQGIGEVKALQLRALIILSGRLLRKEEEKQELTSAESCASFFMEEMLGYEQEVLKAVFLDGKNHLIRSQNISLGSASQTMVPVREILVNAARCRAEKMMLLHNHPSGDPEPSDADIMATRRVAEAGMITGIQLVDHIITGDHRYVSLYDRGLITIY